MARKLVEKTISEGEPGYLSKSSFPNRCCTSNSDGSVGPVLPPYTGSSPWMCTRRMGHSGPHAAHSGSKQFATWED